MKISITIAEDTHRQLNELLCAAKEIGTMGKDSTLSDLVGYAADSMGDGCQPTKLLTPLGDKTPDPLEARQAGGGRA